MFRWALVMVAACSPDARVADRIQPADAPADPSDPIVTTEPTPVDGARTRSGVVVPALADGVAWVVDTDGAQLLRWEAGDLTAHDVGLAGGEPTRAVRVGDDLFITLRASGEIARVIEEGAGVRHLRTVPVGAEPFDVVAHPTDPTLYVSLSMEDAVVELDALSLRELRRWEIGGEPRWMATRVGGSGAPVLAVAVARGAKVWEIDLTSGYAEELPLPRRDRPMPAGCARRTFASRVSGEIAYDGAGVLLVPALYVDPIVDPLREEPGRCGGGGEDLDTGGAPPAPTPGKYARAAAPGDAGTPDRFNPALVRLSRVEGGEAFMLGSAMLAGGGITSARGVASGLEVFDDDVVAVTLETDDAIVVVVPDQPRDEPRTAPFQPALRAAMPAGLGGASPRRVGENQIVSWAWLDRRVQTFDTAEAGLALRGVAPWGMVTFAAAGASPLPAQMELGRRLFYTAGDVRMAAEGAGVSCSTCHVDGRADGFTWRFMDFDRQTPSLAGRVSDTVPVTWIGDVASVFDEVLLTTSLRMGGTGLADAEAHQVAAWIDTIRRPVAPVQPADAVARGRELFESAEVGCVACHAGPAWTTGVSVPLYGLPQVNVPTLRGIAATSPYLHDGSAETLRELLERSRDGSMGDTSGLSDAQLDDLEAFLRSL
jgi:mono/diheme cytochrome c family protein